jgi:hypothetical protein
MDILPDQGIEQGEELGMVGPDCALKCVVPSFDAVVGAREIEFSRALKS